MEHRQGARHHTIVVVDVEGFGDRQRTNLHQRGVRDGLYHVVRTAFETAGVSWAGCYHEDRGDAVFILAPASVSKAVFVEAVPPALVTALRIHNDTHPHAQRIRLRIALHAGEVHYDDHGVTSTSLTLTFRLNDAQPLKAALAASPGVLAVITSDWFFDDVVRHTPGAAPSTYRPIRVTEKETSTIGWITLPDHPYSPDPQRAAPPTVGQSGARSILVPRQLPLVVRDFTGRADQLATLDTLIPPPDSEAGSPEDGAAPTVVITAIDGTAGIGKTTLAVHWAHRSQHRFPDGTLHVNLRGYGPGDPATPGEVLEGFLYALDTPAEKMPIGLDAQAALFRSLLAGRRMLIVLDNANSADQVRPLLPGTAGCMVLVTSRHSLTGLVVTETAHRLTLDLLTPTEAHNLVTGIIGPDRAAAEPEAVTNLIRHCARLPLALRIAAGKVAVHSNTTVAEVVTELDDERNRLNVLSHGNDERAALRAVFDWSYQRLPAKQARLFRRLSLHPGPDLSAPAAAAVAGLDPPTTRRLLNDLAAAHLIEPTTSHRYRFHDLLRAYAIEQADRHDPADEREYARRTVLSWYAHTAHICDEHVYPAHFRLPLQLPAPADAALILDRTQALRWLNDERDNLTAAVRQAVRDRLHKHVVYLADGMRFLGRSGWGELVEFESCGLQAAQDLGDGDAESYFLSRRGEVFAAMRRWDEAQADCDHALALARARGDRIAEGLALSDLGLLYVERGCFQDALSYLSNALALPTRTLRWKAATEGNLSRAYTGLGCYQQAIEHGERCLTLFRRAGDPDSEPHALHCLARAWQGLGEHQKVIDLCREAISVGRTVGYVSDSVAEPLNTLAISLHHNGNTNDAVACWREAAALFDDYGDTYRAAEIRQHLATTLINGEGDEAD